MYGTFKDEDEYGLLESGGALGEEKSLTFNTKTGLEGVHWAAVLGWALCCPFILPKSFTVVEQNTEIVALHCGRFSSVYDTPGCQFLNPCGLEAITISKAKISVDLPNTKVIDLNGNPLIVSGVVVYYWEDTKKAALEVVDREGFVFNQALAVMKHIVGQYPYEHLEDKDHEKADTIEDEKVVFRPPKRAKKPCLKTDSDVVSDQLVSSLQKRIALSGGRIISFRLNEIAYAPEIAQGMLKRQQAEAILQSRRTLVRGAVSIASSTISGMLKAGIEVQADQQALLTSNLLTVLCSDEKVHPVIQLA